MKFRFFFLILLLALLAISVFLFIRSHNEEKSITEEKSIKIGSIVPLTGPFSVYGQPVNEGIQLALREINNSGGINGKKLEILTEDDSGDPTNSVNAISKLINTDKVKLILGPLSSGASLADANISEKNKVIQLSTLAAVPELSNAGDYIFRIYPSTLEGAKFAANFALNKYNPKKVAIIYPRNVFGESSMSVYKTACQQHNINLVDIEAYNDGDKDFRTQILKIKNSKPDIIFCSSYWTEGGIILKQMAELNFNIPIIGEDGWQGNIAEMVSRNSLKNLYFIDLLFSPELGDTAMNNFYANYQKQYNKKPTTYAAAGYDGIYLFKNAIEKNGMDVEKIKNYMYTTPYDGVLSSIKFDKNGDNIGVQFGVYQLDNNNNAILIK